MTASDLPLYLGPQLPRWTPTTTADVDRAIAEGDLAERHFVDVKLFQAFSDSAKKELARDLGSFANDGGVLLYGVDEYKESGELTVRPVVLDGLRERFDQIARYRLDPPLFITTRPLRLPDDGSRGVMVVEIPASPLAPHQVVAEGAYYGRGDTTRTRLTDREIAVLHDRRITRHAAAGDYLERAHRLEVWPSGAHAHAFVVAVPLSSPPDLLTGRLDGPYQLIAPVHEWWRQVPGAERIGYTYSHLSEAVSTSSGVSLRTPEYGYRENPANEPATMSLELHDDATVEFYAGGASKAGTWNGDPSIHWVFPERIIVWSESIIRTAAALAAQSGYSGAWLVAIEVRNIAGMADSVLRETAGPLQLWPASDDPFSDTTESRTAEMLERPEAVVHRLVRRFLRGLGTRLRYETHFDRSRDSR